MKTPVKNLTCSLVNWLTPGTVGIMICMAKYRAKQMQQGRQRRSPHRPNDDPNVFAGKLYNIVQKKNNINYRII